MNLTIGTLRKWIGALILAATIGITGLAAIRVHQETAGNFIIGYVRGERLADNADGQIAEVASFMKGDTTLKAKITGFTESGGDATADVELSEIRANKVRDLLIAAGVEADRLSTAGLGSTSLLPKQESESDADWSRRQARAEIHLEKTR